MLIQVKLCLVTLLHDDFAVVCRRWSHVSPSVPLVRWSPTGEILRVKRGVVAIRRLVNRANEMFMGLGKLTLKCYWNNSISIRNDVTNDVTDNLADDVADDV